MGANINGSKGTIFEGICGNVRQFIKCNGIEVSTSFECI